MPKETITAKIYDPNHRYLYDLKGEVIENVFIWKENTLLGLGGTQKKTALDYSLILELTKKVKVAFYTYDGKDYTQISFKELGKTVNITDLFNSFKLAELEKNTILKPPFNLTALIPFLVLLLGVVIMVILYLATQNVVKGLTNLYAPVSKTLNITQKICTLSENQSIVVTRLANATLTYVNQRNGLPSGVG